jgi:L-cysteine/cystine lyase
VTTTEEHFGLLGPVYASGARVVVAEPDPDAILAEVTPRTKLLALSQVLWTSGRALPVRELRQQTGVPVLVDGAQSVGAIPIDVTGLDFLTISGQKWLCGPDSTGALVVADPERLRVARPSYFSQASYEPSGSFEPAAGAARFDHGWLSSAVLAGLLTAIAIRPAWAFEHASVQAARCRELLAPLAEVVPGGATLVAFRAEDPPALVAGLAEEGVVVREIPKTGLVRVSCGWWTNEDDLERLVGGIA